MMEVYEKSMNNRPITTLFLLTSVDGKISTGATDEMDVDRDFPAIKGVSEGLHQYYEIESTTDLWSLNSGRVQAKIGVNEKPIPHKRQSVSFVIVDNKHLTRHGVEYFTHLSKTFVLITANRSHPAYESQADNLHILCYDKLNVKKALEDLYEKFDCKRITLQSGGTLNALFLRSKLIDFVDIIVAPVLIGGKDTATLIDGESLTSKSELNKLGVLQLQKAEPLQNSYVRLMYRVAG